MACAGAYLWRLPLWQLFRPDALVMLLHCRTVYRRVRLVLALFRKCKSQLPGSDDHLVLCHHRSCRSPADDRLSFIGLRTPADTSRPHAQPALVLLSPTALCCLGELPRILLSRCDPWGSLLLQFLLRFS